MFKQFLWHAFDENRLASLIYGVEFQAKREAPLTTLVEVLNKTGCKSVMIEQDYIDGDYKNEFSHFYCKPFKIYSSRCQRLHFLTRPYSGDNVFDPETLLQQEYLGFCVIRPTESNRIGRTVVRFPRAENEYLTCKQTFTVHLLGKPYSVEGFPFIQQDTHVGVCAHASLWMVARYMNTMGYCGRYGLADINLMAKRFETTGRDLPSDQGLTQQQMLDALQGMGLSATLFEMGNLPDEADPQSDFDRQITEAISAEDTVKLKRVIQSIRLAELAYRYIESRLPVLFMTKDHVFVGLGHGFDPVNKTPSRFGRVPHFIIHDDNHGPYQSLPIIPDRVEGFSAKKGSNREGTESIARRGSIFDVTGIIIVTPPSVNLPGENAENEARSMIEQLRRWSELRRPDFPELNASLSPQHEFRTYLLNSCELQRDLLSEKEEQKGHSPESHIHELLRLDYPHYVWVIEIFAATDAVDNSRPNRRYVGRCFIDSTGSRLVSNVIYFSYQGFFILRDRQGRQPNITRCEVNTLQPKEKQIAATS